MFHDTLSKSNTSPAPKKLSLTTNWSVCKTHYGLRSLSHTFSNDFVIFLNNSVEKKYSGMSTFKGHFCESFLNRVVLVYIKN